MMHLHENKKCEKRWKTLRSTRQLSWKKRAISIYIYVLCVFVFLNNPTVSRKEILKKSLFTILWCLNRNMYWIFSDGILQRVGMTQNPIWWFPKSWRYPPKSSILWDKYIYIYILYKSYFPIIYIYIYNFHGIVHSKPSILGYPHYGNPLTIQPFNKSLRRLSCEKLL